MLSRKSSIALVVLLGAAGVLVFRARQAGTGSGPGGPVPSAAPASQAAGTGDRAAADPAATTLARLREKPTRDDALGALRDLQSRLKVMPKDEAVGWIRGYLDGGEDVVTGLSYEIGPDGMLKEWPSFRTFLLDTLLAIDPVAAAAVGRQVLTKPTSADEWSVALRNVGRGENAPETKEYLRERTEALIANPEWQANPSVGYLNAFDVLVHAEATASTPVLSGLIQRKDRKDLAHAGFLTLDRLVQRQPQDMLTRLAADQALHASRPEMVAQQFARADLRDPAQQAIVKAWLLDPARTPVELRAFAGVYPNNNHFVSHNLLTTQRTAAGQDLAAHDREVLTIVAAWQADPAFQPVAEHLKTMVSRLTEFTKVPAP